MMSTHYIEKLLCELERDVKKIARHIRPLKNDFPLFGTVADLGHPYIEVDENGYHFVVQERGHEIRRITTKNIEEILYLIFEEITRTMAIRFGKRMANQGKDFRRLYFAKQEELLETVNPLWRERIDIAHRRILTEAPFDDFANERAIFCSELYKQGYTDEHAWRLACEKYPLPQ